MNSARALSIAVVLLFTSQLGSAQDLSRYRVYVLESSLESVVAVSGARAADTKTLHERPARIQQLEWRAPYASSVARWLTLCAGLFLPSTTTPCIRSSSATIATARTD